MRRAVVGIQGWGTGRGTSPARRPLLSAAYSWQPWSQLASAGHRCGWVRRASSASGHAAPGRRAEPDAGTAAGREAAAKLATVRLARIVAAGKYYRALKYLDKLEKEGVVNQFHYAVLLPGCRGPRQISSLLARLGRRRLRMTPAIQNAAHEVRCVWIFLDLPPTKDWRFPFNLPKRGPVISKRIVPRAAGRSIRQLPHCAGADRAPRRPGHGLASTRRRWRHCWGEARRQASCGGCLRARPAPLSTWCSGWAAAAFEGAGRRWRTSQCWGWPGSPHPGTTACCWSAAQMPKSSVRPPPGGPLPRARAP